MLRSRLVLPLLAGLLVLSACDTGDPTPDEVRRVFITEIAIDDAPLMQPNGDDWDGATGGGPDIYIELINGGALVASFEGDEFSGVDNNDFPLVWLPVPEIEFTRFNVDLGVDLFDEDPTTADDFMGGTETVNLQELIDSGVPNFVRLESADEEIQVSIRLRYER